MHSSSFFSYGMAVASMVLLPFYVNAQCYHDRLPAIPNDKNAPVMGAMAGQEKIVSFTYEVDYFTYSAFGNVSDTEQWAKDQYRDMANAYAAAGVSTALTYIRINTSPDWSSSLSDPGDLLNEFSRVRAGDPTGRIKMFLTMKGPLVGVAWIDQFDRDGGSFNSGNCPNGTCHFGAYGINMGLDNNPNSSWDLQVLTHEAGHVFGLFHSFDCRYGPNGNQALTSCLNPSCSVVSPPEDATWMSYCSAGLNGFGPTHTNQLASAIIQTPRDLLDGTPIIITIASNVTGSFHYTDEVVFSPSYEGDLPIEFIKLAP